MDREQLFESARDFPPTPNNPAENSELEQEDDTEDEQPEYIAVNTTDMDCEEDQPEEGIYQKLAGDSSQEEEHRGSEDMEDQNPESLFVHFRNQSQRSNGKEQFQRGFSERELSMEEIFLDEEIRASLSTARIMAKREPDEVLDRSKLPIANRSQLNLPVVRRRHHGLYAALVVLLIVCAGFPVYQFSLAPLLSNTEKSVVDPLKSEPETNLERNQHSVEGLKRLADRPSLESSSKLVTSAVTQVLGQNLFAEGQSDEHFQASEEVEPNPLQNEAESFTEEILNVDVEPAVHIAPPKKPEPVISAAENIMINPFTEDPMEEPLLRTTKLSGPLMPEIKFEDIEEEPSRKESLSSGWFVQIAAKESADAADGLTDLITSKGFISSVRNAEVKNKMYYRVVIGPYNTRKSAIAALPKIAKSSPLAKDAFVRYLED